MNNIKPITFKRFSEIATVHGLYRVGHSTSFIQKAAWGLLVTSLVCTVTALTSLTLMEHYSHPYLTEVEKVTANEMAFPSVTICQANNFKVSAFASLVPNITELVANLVKLTITESLTKREIIPPTLSQIAMAFANAYINSSAIRQYSATPDAIYWNFQEWCKFSIRKICKYPEDFRYYFFSSKMGFCKTFNTNRTYTQIAPGGEFGLSLKLYVDENGKVPILNDNGAGLILMVHPQDAYPNPYTEGILLPLGHESHISLKKLTFHRLKSPYRSNCTVGTGEFLIYPGMYTVQNCQYSCFLKYLLEECGYHEAAFQYHKPKEYAESLKLAAKKNFTAQEVSNCLREVMEKIHSSKSHNCQCRPACYEEKILTRTTYTQWPHPANAEYYRKLISNITNRKNMTRAEMYESVASVRIFFDELGHDIIRESPRSSIANLFSQVGGQFGLWIGASIFSLTEIILFIFNSFFFLCKGKGEPEKEKDTTVTEFNSMNNPSTFTRFAWEREINN